MPDAFKGAFNAFDKMEALPKLARVIYNLTDAELPERESRKLAIKLAQDYLPLLRGVVNFAESRDKAKAVKTPSAVNPQP